ncbi:DedA family protein [Nocardiopsis synnemataformans]|uniref:DedA family protein n=1 Tax=Nocardiopsis synnemataformans TaxID=61305 RepID=UPI003EB905B1
MNPLDAITAGTPLSYLMLIACLAGSAVFPPLPSEAAIFTAGALAGAGRLNVIAVALCGAVGSMLGDGTGYLVGRLFGQRALAGLRRRERGGRAAEWARGRIERYGGPGIAVSRFVPGGQSAFSITAGTLTYPLRRYVLYSALGACLWAVYGTLVGVLGGSALAAGNWIGVVLAVLAVVLIVTAPRLLRRRRQRASTLQSHGQDC